MNIPNLTPVFCAANGILIDQFDDEKIIFGLLDMNDEILKLRIKKSYPGFKCVFINLDTDVFNLKLSQLYSEDIEPNEIGGNYKFLDNRESIIDKVADDAPAINLLNSIFLEAISRRASDIHIESGREEADIRCRIDGILITVKKINRDRGIAISARLKILSNLNVLENRRPQDGHIDIKTDSYSLDVRISIIPTIWGESIVLRLLNRSDINFSLDTLGFSENNYNSILDMLKNRSGLILITGPTGSGKTTTLAAILKTLDIKKTKIISIEDPVEYRIDGITQIQVNEELELTFDSLLRRIFRQDPDIIMIGEIRDIQTAELAIRAALTGHLVFATLHTNNSIEAIYRLQNMGIQSFMLAGVLKTIIAQRLIRKICPVCSNLGCEKCSNTGFYGRTVISELIPISTVLQDLISKGISTAEMRAYLENIKFKNLFDDAEEKIKEKITIKAEVMRELGVRNE